MQQSIVAVAEAEAPTKPVEAAPARSVKERILSLVVEKTGYPEEMLDLDLDMEADLGVDTVKQAEIFAAIREIGSVPRGEDGKIRGCATLVHVIGCVYEKRADLAGAVAAPPQPVIKTATPSDPAATASFATAVTPAPAQAHEDATPRILALVVEKTGYPEEMLDLDLDMEADLGVDTVKQAETFAAIR